MKCCGKTFSKLVNAMKIAIITMLSASIKILMQWWVALKEWKTICVNAVLTQHNQQR
jgi:hypothetical protein